MGQCRGPPARWSYRWSIAAFSFSRIRSRSLRELHSISASAATRLADFLRACHSNRAAAVAGFWRARRGFQSAASLSPRLAQLHLLKLLSFPAAQFRSALNPDLSGTLLCAAPSPNVLSAVRWTDDRLFPGSDFQGRHR